MPKGASRANAMLNIEKIKPISLAVIKLRLSEGISQLLSQSVENSVINLAAAHDGFPLKWKLSVLFIVAILIVRTVLDLYCCVTG